MIRKYIKWNRHKNTRQMFPNNTEEEIWHWKQKREADGRLCGRGESQDPC